MFFNIPEASWAWPVVATKPISDTDLGKLISAVWSVPTMGWLDKLLLVDDDVDITSTEELLEILGTRLRAERVYESKPNKPISFIAAWASEEELRRGLAGALTYDCVTRPEEEKPEKITIETLFKPETQKWLDNFWLRAVSR